MSGPIGVRFHPSNVKVEPANLDNRVLQLLQQAAEHFQSLHQQAYLVGGSLRNILLAEPCSDWDIVTTGDVPSIARLLADKLHGHYAYLHEKASRVIIPPSSTDNSTEIILDIAPLKGRTLENDLRQRDFTINAIAAPLEDVVRHLTDNAPTQTMRLIDPLHGLADIAAHRLKAVDSHVFQHDPLRMLRAVRLIMRYHLSIDSSTEGLLMRDSSLLLQVASERIHDELYAILAPDGAAERLQFLDAHGLLTTLIPEFIPARGMAQPQPHYWDVLDHSIQAVRALEQLATLLQQPPAVIQQSPLENHAACNLVTIQQLLIEAEEQGIFQRAMLTSPPMKLATLLHDIGKPATYTIDEDDHIHFYGHPQAGIPLVQHIMKRLSVSTQDRRLVQQVTSHHMRPGQLGQQGAAITPRAIRRYFVDLGPTGIAVALFSLADHIATRGPTFGTPEQQAVTIASWEQHITTVCLLLSTYIRDRASVLPPQLISAEELMRRLNLTPGPIIGQLLDQIAEAQAEGLVHSKEEAVWLAEEKLL